MIPALVCLVAAAGCSKGTKKADDPLLDVANRELSARARSEAVEPARAEVMAEPSRLANTQRVFKDIVWTASEPPVVRMAVLSSLLNDPDPRISEDARETVKLLIPKERSLPVMILVCRVVAEKGWTDCVPALVRSYSRPTDLIGWTGGIQEKDRPEREAIERLSGGRDVVDVTFELFLKPPPATLAPAFGVDWTERFRADCWDLLARLDMQGDRREAMLKSVAADTTDSLVINIRRSVDELRAVPRTGEELKWLTRLLDPTKPANAAWWEQARAAVGRLPSDAGPLQLRHAEAIRWASVAHPQWLEASRGELLSMLERRLDGRRFHDREVEAARFRVRERLKFWADDLAWPDLLTILLVDEVVHQPGVTRMLASQAVLDRKDESTEYGGILARKNVGLGAVPREEWLAQLFPPRPGQRQGDERFVASDDMLTASDTALAHYHFHVQKERNESFAGPSPGDLGYAERFGRACVVLTSVGKGGRMDVDYYQPDGTVIDLGEIWPVAEVDSGMERGVGPR